MSQTRLICSKCRFALIDCLCVQSNEQSANNEEILKAHNPHSIVQSARNHGETLTDRPLVGEGE